MMKGSSRIVATTTSASTSWMMLGLPFRRRSRWISSTKPCADSVSSPVSRMRFSANTFRCGDMTCAQLGRLLSHHQPSKEALGNVVGVQDI